MVTELVERHGILLKGQVAENAWTPLDRVPGHGEITEREIQGEAAAVAREGIVGYRTGYAVDLAIPAFAIERLGVEGRGLGHEHPDIDLERGGTLAAGSKQAALHGTLYIADPPAIQATEQTHAQVIRVRGIGIVKAVFPAAKGNSTRSLFR